jgi:hypothetical protein
MRSSFGESAAATSAAAVTGGGRGDHAFSSGCVAKSTSSIPREGGGNIGQVANVLLSRRGQDRCVEIRIDIDAARPPAGRVQPPDGAPIRFDGWLSLLAVLERLVEEPMGSGQPSSASGLSGATSREDRR